MKRLMKRVIGVIPAFTVQIMWYVLLFKWMSPWTTTINLILSVLAIIFILYIITNNDESTYKILWILVILGLPLFGTVLYMMYGNKRTTRFLKKKLKENEVDHKELLKESVSGEVESARLRQTIQYMENITGFPLQKNEKTVYAPLGDDMFPVMIENMKTAQKYIFMEYFILESGYMLDTMVDILEAKVKEGVDVRVMFDDLGSIGTYSKEEVKRLREKGILCYAFNPAYLIKGTLNNRDHRKMMIIDGRIAFTGGINISDEYINYVEKHGHWKDIGFYTEGHAVKNYTVMFVEFWNAFTPEKISPERLESLLADPVQTNEIQDGYILSYYDSPIRREDASNELYIELLSQAKDYAYFYTPYLMLGEELLTAFQRAAKRGVDVRIIIPGVPDKKLIYRMSRSFYPPLVESGVSIYEYDPGFVHAKGCVIDGKAATVGTVNLDYRSLFLNFENNALFCQSRIVDAVERDFLAAQERCHKVMLENDIKLTFVRWFVNGILRTISPLC